jgi:hypothetical protein
MKSNNKNTIKSIKTKNHSFISIVLITIVSLLSCTDEKLDFSEVGKITGRVVQAESFEPIANSKVSISPSNNTVFSDEDGYFTFEEIPVGEYSIQAEKEGFLAGYEPTSLEAGATVNIIFELEDSDALNKPPSAPNLLSPNDDATDIDLEVELVWSKSIDPDEDALIYGIKIRNDYDNNLINIESLTDTTYVVNNLRHGVKYFWQVSVNDSHNNEVLTSISTFETSSYPNNRYFYVKKENDHNVIYSSNDTGNELQITSSDQNSWRPRNNQTAHLVAFLRTIDTETHIFTMKPDGTDIHQVTSANPLIGFKQNEIDFSWSANGSKILYPSFDKLYLINKDGSGNHLIYQTDDGSYITECDWSDDGSIVALKTNDIYGYHVSIFTINLSGTVQTTILNNVLGAAGGINLSVDNNLLLYTYDVSEFENANYRQLNTNLFLYNFSTGERSNISFNKAAGTNDLDPRFSPNESKVIMVNTSNDGISNKQIYLLDISGESREMIIDHSFMPDWE